jgi:hypothetical protein
VALERRLQSGAAPPAPAEVVPRAAPRAPVATAPVPPTPSARAPIASAPAARPSGEDAEIAPQVAPEIAPEIAPGVAPEPRRASPPPPGESDAFTQRVADLFTGNIED